MMHINSNTFWNQTYCFFFTENILLLLPDKCGHGYRGKTWQDYMGGNFWRVKQIMYLVLLLFTEDCKVVQCVFLYQKLSCSKVKDKPPRETLKFVKAKCRKNASLGLIIYTWCSDSLPGYLSAVYILSPDYCWDGLGYRQKKNPARVNGYVCSKSLSSFHGNRRTPSIIQRARCIVNWV